MEKGGVVLIELSGWFCAIRLWNVMSCCNDYTNLIVGRGLSHVVDGWMDG